MTDAELVALTRRFHVLMGTVTARTMAAVAAGWDGLGSYDEADVARFERRVAPATTAGKTAAVRLATGFYSTVAGVRPAALTLTAVAVVFEARTPFLAHWHALKEGRQWPEAQLAGRARAEAMASKLVVSSSRRTGDLALPGHQRWRRSTGGDACDWCLEAAGKVYSSAEAADFGHDKCGCVATPA